jgi:hypothetical protein
VRRKSFKFISLLKLVFIEGKLLFGQVPLLEIHGKNLVQSGAIVRYLAKLANLLGDNADDAVK